MFTGWTVRAAVALLAPPAAVGAVAWAQTADAPTFSDIQPILNERCVKCHSGDAPPVGLALDSLDHVMSGSWNGRVVVPGDPEESELVRRVKGISLPQMPYDGPPFLDDDQIALIEVWVAAGAPAGDPAAAAPEAPAEPQLPGPDEPVLFSHVEPIFLQRCVECHSDARDGGAPEGLSLTSRGEMLAGGDRTVIVPGNSGASEIVRRIRGQSLPRMPFDGPPYLDEEQIRLIVDWIEQGARDDDGNAASVPVGGKLRLEGTLTERWELDGTPLTVPTDTRIDEDAGVGTRVEIRGIVGEDGAIVVERIDDR